MEPTSVPSFTHVVQTEVFPLGAIEGADEPISEVRLATAAPRAAASDALSIPRAVVAPVMSSNSMDDARSALGALLAGQPGGKGPEEMTPRKAERARKFRVGARDAGQRTGAPALG
jgi:hypothetical protein